MTVRKLSLRHVRFRVARLLVNSVPGLRCRVPYYDVVKRMIEVGRAETITEAQPLNLGAEEAAFAAKVYGSLPSQLERSIALITLENVTVLGSTGAVVDEAREQLLTHRGQRSFATYHDFRPVISTVVTKPDALYFNMMGSHRGYQHYYHFMFDRLPRLYYLLNRFDMGSERVTVLTNTELPAFQRDILRFIEQRWPNVSFQAVPPGERWRLPRLLHLDDYQPIERTFADPRLLDFIRSLVFDGYGIVPSQHPRRRIYVTRNDTRLRRLANEREMLPILDSHGFEVVAPGTRSFREQVELFASAEMVAGPHGAGLTNILFAPKTARVLEMFPADKLIGCYFLLSLALGQSYRAVIGENGNRWEWFTVERGAVDRAIAGLVAG